MTDDDKKRPPLSGSGPEASPVGLTRTALAKLPTSTTQTDFDRIDSGPDQWRPPAEPGVAVVDRPSLLWELENATAGGGPRPVDPRPLVDEELAAPSRTGKPKYETLGVLGYGGMGEVYEVADVDLKRTVALKRIKKDMLSPRATALFLQEAQITAQLEHPNIVPVHDAGRTASGEAFFTMKLLRGLTLRQVIMQIGSGEPSAVARFTPMRVGITFLEVVRAVAYAHARGVVHCDLKPSNVLIGAHGEVVVGDWGLARRDVLAWPEGALKSTAPRVSFPPGAPDFKGVISGSIPYMAPEQIASDDVDRRADVYSLGAILYELLTLQPICAAASHSDLLRRVKLGVPSPRERAPFLEISEEIDAICMKCLRADPAQRYQSGGELEDVIEAWLTGARRRSAAELAFRDGERAHAKLETLTAERGFLLEDKRALEEKIKPFDGEAKKIPLWAVEDRLFAIDVESEQETAHALDAWGHAASLDGSFLPPQDRLADLHLALFLRAEEKGRVLDERLHRRQ
ncbi:MAG TPA: serine/threonine-protein kinase, partial [Myxococcota bacterium]